MNTFECPLVPLRFFPIFVLEGPLTLWIFWMFLRSFGLLVKTLYSIFLWNQLMTSKILEFSLKVLGMSFDPFTCFFSIIFRIIRIFWRSFDLWVETLFSSCFWNQPLTSKNLRIFLEGLGNVLWSRLSVFFNNWPWMSFDSLNFFEGSSASGPRHLIAIASEISCWYLQTEIFFLRMLEMFFGPFYVFFSIIFLECPFNLWIFRIFLKSPSAYRPRHFLAFSSEISYWHLKT